MKGTRPRGKTQPPLHAASGRDTLGGLVDAALRLAAGRVPLLGTQPSNVPKSMLAAIVPPFSPVQLQQQGRTRGAESPMRQRKTQPTQTGRLKRRAGGAAQRALGCARGHRTQAPQIERDA